MPHHPASVLTAAAAALTLIAGSARAAIVNGDFESGNTGFTSAYEYRTVSVSPNVNQYGVTHSSFEWSQFWGTVPGDHTSGHGLFLIVDVGSTATFWQQTVSVSPNTAYTFGAFLSTWTTFPAGSFAVEINGSIVANWNGPGTATWTPYSANWNSGAATSATIRMFATTVFQPGDDVAIDDITFVPAPGSAALLGLAGAATLRRRRRRRRR